MDYRDTEDFARRMEAAYRHSHALRREAVAQFWSDTARLLLRGWRAARARASRLSTQLQRG
jgi:hypothetical protein